MLRKSALAFAVVGSMVFGALNGAAFAQDRVLVSAVGTNPPHFNRLLTTEVATSTISAALFDTLIRLDSSYTPVPDLATAWEASADATEYRFTIRDNAKWHNGQPVTPDDVVFTISTYLPLTPQISILKGYLESATVDGNTVIVKLNKPFAPFVEAMAGLPIVPRHVYGDGQDIATHPANLNPVGSGPFKLESFASGDRVVLVRNDDYFGAKSDVERMVFPILPDANARILALEAGDVHYVAGSYIDKSAYERLSKDPRFIGLDVLGGVSTVTIHPNTRGDSPLAKYEVRKAVYQALNRQMIAERAYFGYAKPSRGPIPSALSWPVSADVDFNKDLPFDAAAAAAALDAAGYPVGADGKRFTLSLSYIAEYGSQGAAANVIKANLADIGVEVNLVGEEFSVWAQRTYKDHKFDLSMVFYTSYEDPSIGVARIYVCNPDDVMFRNASGLCDPAIDEDFATASRTTDRDARRTAFAAAEKKIEGLLQTYPVVEEPSKHFGRQDIWNLEAAHKVYPPDWSLVTAK